MLVYVSMTFLYW